MATPLQHRDPNTPSSLAGHRGGSAHRGLSPFGPVVYNFKPDVWPMLKGVPLAVRLRTAKADRFVSSSIRDLRFRSAVPGGFASASFSIERSIASDPDEIQQFGDVFIYDGRNGRTIWQGRLEDPGRGASPAGQVWQVSALGPAAHTRDRSVPLIYVDRSLERLFPYAVNSTTGKIEKIADADDATGGWLKASCPNGNVAVSTGFRQGHQYNALKECGQNLARYHFDWDVGKTDADWQVRTRTGSATLALLEDDIDWNVAGGSVTKVITTDFGATQQLIAFTAERLGANQTVADETTWALWMNLVIQGTRYSAAGSELTNGATDYPNDTILASDVVKDLLGRLLSEFDGAGASVATTSFGIEQLAYPDCATPFEILGDLMMFEADYYWAAWEDTNTGKSRFEWRAWPSTVRYEATAASGFESPASAADIYNAVAVRWRDNFGRVRRNRRTLTVPALGSLTREATIDLGDVVGTSANADRVGDQFLSDHATGANAGSLRVQVPIFDRDRGQMVEPFEIVPGHLIRVRNVRPRIDALNPSARDAVTIFRVLSVEYDVGSGAAVLELDSKRRTLDRLLGPRTVDRHSTKRRR